MKPDPFMLAITRSLCWILLDERKVRAIIRRRCPVPFHLMRTTALIDWHS